MYRVSSTRSNCVDEILAFGESVSVIRRAGRVDLAEPVNSVKSIRIKGEKHKHKESRARSSTPDRNRNRPHDLIPASSIPFDRALSYPLLDLLSDLADLLLGPDDDSVQIPFDLLGGGDGMEDAVVQLPILVLDVDE